MLGIQVEEDEFNYLKGELKRDIRRNVHYLRRYEYAYIREYLDRRDEIDSEKAVEFNRRQF